MSAGPWKGNGLCDCGKPATHSLKVMIETATDRGRATRVPCTILLCDRCWELEQEQAQLVGGGRQTHGFVGAVRVG
jgi:hypothetical protein